SVPCPKARRVAVGVVSVQEGYPALPQPYRAVDGVGLGGQRGAGRVKNLQPCQAVKRDRPITRSQRHPQALPTRSLHPTRASPVERLRRRRWWRTRKVWRATRKSNCLRAMLKTSKPAAVFLISIPGDVRRTTYAGSTARDTGRAA